MKDQVKLYYIKFDNFILNVAMQLICLILLKIKSILPQTYKI